MRTVPTKVSTVAKVRLSTESGPVTLKALKAKLSKALSLSLSLSPLSSQRVIRFYSFHFLFFSFRCSRNGGPFRALFFDRARGGRAVLGKSVSRLSAKFFLSFFYSTRPRLGTSLAGARGRPPAFRKNFTSFFFLSFPYSPCRLPFSKSLS